METDLFQENTNIFVKRNKMAYEIFHPDSDYGSIEFKSGKWNTLRVDTVYSYINSDTNLQTYSDVELESSDGDNNIHIFLDQEDLKALITHLQKQVK